MSHEVLDDCDLRVKKFQDALDDKAFCDFCLMLNYARENSGGDITFPECDDDVIYRHQEFDTRREEFINSIFALYDCDPARAYNKLKNSLYQFTDKEMKEIFHCNGFEISKDDAGICIEGENSFHRIVNQKETSLFKT